MRSSDASVVYVQTVDPQQLEESMEGYAVWADGNFTHFDRWAAVPLGWSHGLRYDLRLMNGECGSACLLYCSRDDGVGQDADGPDNVSTSRLRKTKRYVRASSPQLCEPRLRSTCGLNLHRGVLTRSCVYGVFVCSKSLRVGDRLPEIQSRKLSPHTLCICEQ